MTKEELEKERFVKSYPEFCCNGAPLSPYCADKFRDIQCGGMLGDMTKEGKHEKEQIEGK